MNTVQVVFGPPYLYSSFNLVQDVSLILSGDYHEDRRTYLRLAMLRMLLQSP